jgi:hypothetical protein
MIDRRLPKVHVSTMSESLRLVPNRSPRDVRMEWSTAFEDLVEAESAGLASEEVAVGIIYFRRSGVHAG